jgi:putative cardiolipin synthase
MNRRSTARTLAIRAAWPLLLLLVAGCAQLPQRPATPVESAVAVGTGTELDRLIAPAEQRHPGQSGFRLVSDGPEAFAVRAHSARIAGRSVDVQTYIWHGDQTGLALAQVLLKAADRGVKVRLLIDDMDARAKNDGLAALAAHPNIAVRTFNPLPSRSGTIAFLGDLLGDGKRLNRRMHNKTWIADNRMAIIGGRNLGDEYFGASDGPNFVDLDFAAVGPVVQDASASFDRYWNSPAAYPIAVLSPEEVTDAALEKLRGRLAQALEDAKQGAYAELLLRDDAVTRLVGGDWPMTWSSDYRFVADDPGKIQTDPDRSHSDVLKILAPVLRGAQQDLTIISPYFVPRDTGTKVLVESAQSGTRVRVLTNSLAANDVAAVHGGYAQYRERLLEGSVQLWELKPLPGVETPSSLFGSGGASLHTKGLAVDGTTIFVGSYNLDPRSTSLNCEQGVLVQSDVLAQQFMALFDRQVSGERAWKVDLVEGDLSWSDGSTTYDSEPEASSGRKFQAWFAGLLPIETQL